jgi:hypothetical protein
VSSIYYVSLVSSYACKSTPLSNQKEPKHPISSNTVYLVQPAAP